MFKTKEKQLEYVRDWRRRNKDKTRKYNKEVRPAKEKTRRKELKLEGIKLLGGKCSICGYNKNIAALDFHHIDKNKKEYEIAKLISYRSVTKFHKEVKKCILLCANCHRELHNSLN